MRRQPCNHAQAEPVEAIGEIVAALCPTCGDQLPAEFIGCSHLNTIDVTGMGESPGRKLCNDCGSSGWYDT